MNHSSGFESDRLSIPAVSKTLSSLSSPPSLPSKKPAAKFLRSSWSNSYSGSSDWTSMSLGKLGIFHLWPAPVSRINLGDAICPIVNVTHSSADSLPLPRIFEAFAAEDKEVSWFSGRARCSSAEDRSAENCARERFSFYECLCISMNCYE